MEILLALFGSALLVLLGPWLPLRLLSPAPFTPLVVDAGLSPQGLALVQALQRRDPTLLFCPAEEATYILQRKGDHGYFSL